MWFDNNNAPLPTSVITASEGLEFEIVTSYKYLGVWLDGTLSFSQHKSKLQAKVKSRLGFLYHNHSSFTLDGHYHSSIRFASNVPYRTRHCTLYSVNWQFLYTRRKIHWLMLSYKTLRSHSPLQHILHIQNLF